jgi:hypothetical protein
VDERRQCLSRRLPPTDAEGVAGWVGVHLVPLVAFHVTGLEKSCTEPQSLFVRGLRVLNMKVHMDLVRRSVWPDWRNVLGHELNPSPPLTSGIDDAVECLVLEDVSVEDACPERALSV